MFLRKGWKRILLKNHCLAQITCWRFNTQNLSLFREKLHFKDEVQYVTTLPETTMLEINLLNIAVKVVLQERSKVYCAYGN